MTDQEAADILEALDKSEQWLTNTTSLALRAGAAALRDRARSAAIAAAMRQTVRLEVVGD